MNKETKTELYDKIVEQNKKGGVVEFYLVRNENALRREKPFVINVLSHSFFYKTIDEAMREMNELYNEWKDKPINVKFLNKANDINFSIFHQIDNNHKRAIYEVVELFALVELIEHPKLSKNDVIDYFEYSYDYLSALDIVRTAKSKQELLDWLEKNKDEKKVRGKDFTIITIYRTQYMVV
jgi:hypothetical protein